MRGDCLPPRTGLQPAPLWCVAENYRSIDAFLQLRDAIASGQLGTIARLTMNVDLGKGVRSWLCASCAYRLLLNVCMCCIRSRAERFLLPPNASAQPSAMDPGNKYYSSAWRRDSTSMPGGHAAYAQHCSLQWIATKIGSNYDPPVAALPPLSSAEHTAIGLA